jgi:hypothetical protein
VSGRFGALVSVLRTVRENVPYSLDRRGRGTWNVLLRMVRVRMPSIGVYGIGCRMYDAKYRGPGPGPGYFGCGLPQCHKWDSHCVICRNAECSAWPITFSHPPPAVNEAIVNVMCALSLAPKLICRSPIFSRGVASRTPHQGAMGELAFSHGRS